MTAPETIAQEGTPMLVRADRAALLRALRIITQVAKPTRRKTMIPILSCVHITAEDDRLSLTATNLDMEITTSVPAEIEAPGAAVVNAAVLQMVLQRLGGVSQVELAVDAHLRLTAGRLRFNLAKLSEENWPAMPVSDMPHRFRLPADQLRDVLDRSCFAISTQETRYYLNGLYLCASKTDGRKVMRAVSTDGHRMAWVDRPLPDGAAGMPGVIVPRVCALGLRSLVDKADGDVEIELSPLMALFRVGETALRSKLIDGTFPEYEKAVPLNNHKILKVGRLELGMALRHISAFSPKRSFQVRLHLDPAGIKLSVVSPNAGYAEEGIDGTYSGQPILLGVNSNFLMDLIRAGTGATMRFEIDTPQKHSPILVRDAADPGSLWVQMPWQVT